MSNAAAGSTVVLVPGVLGGLKLFQRAPHGGPLRHLCTVVEPLELSSCVHQLEAPRSVVLCDARYRDVVAAAVLRIADLYVVPALWLRDIEQWDTEQRAERAAALVTAHRKRPIEHVIGGRQLEMLLPF